MSRTVRTILIYALILTGVLIAVSVFTTSANQPNEISLSEFTNKVDAGEIQSVRIFPKSDVLEGYLEGTDTEAADPDFAFSYPAEFEDEITSSSRTTTSPPPRIPSRRAS